MGPITDRRLLRVGRLLALLGAALGFLGMLGHLVGVPRLTSFVSGRPVMPPLAALSLIIAGVGVAFRCREDTRLIDRAISV
ncbi:MAG: hypothetical protein H5U40_07250, partial [Polyangiaceae bacterium]|nr:hypothetical protein [Polyangiaceae bacterium]